MDNPSVLTIICTTIPVQWQFGLLRGDDTRMQANSSVLLPVVSSGSSSVFKYKGLTELAANLRSVAGIILVSGMPY
jgi:hypothetical protein